MFTKIKLIVLITVLLFSGCSADGDYTEAKNEFYNTYFDIVKSIDSSDTVESLKRLQSEENTERIKKLQSILGEIDKYTNSYTEKEKSFGINTKKQMYDDLVFLQESYNRFEKLSRDEKRKIGIVLVNTAMNLENWNDKTSSRVWP